MRVIIKTRADLDTLWGEPEQAVCQLGLQLRIRSSYTRVPFRTSCWGIEVGVAFSERISRGSE